MKSKIERKYRGKVYEGENGKNVEKIERQNISFKLSTP